MKGVLFRKAIIGFVIGMISGYLITASINLANGFGFVVVTKTLSDSVGMGAAVILQGLFSGLYGMICIGGTEFYRIESWSLLQSTVAHYICVLVTFTSVGLVLGWLRFDLFSFLYLVFITILFFAIWFIMSLFWKRTVRQMNSELEKYKKENSK